MTPRTELLMSKIRQQIRWYEHECDVTGVTLTDLLEHLPKYYAAYMDQMKEMESAYFDDSSHRMDIAMERARKIFSRGAREFTVLAA